MLSLLIYQIYVIVANTKLAEVVSIGVDERQYYWLTGRIRRT